MRFFTKEPIYIVLFIAHLLFSQVAFAQVPSSPLTVTIYDENANPLPGVNVFTSDRQFQYTSDEQGVIRIPRLPTKYELLFSFIGYETLTISVADLLRSGAEVYMQPEAIQLLTVEKIGRRDDRLHHAFQQVKIIKAEEARRTNPANTADLLNDHGGVFVQKSQLGGGSPIVRGFEANRVLLVVDGVRMNNAIYRSGLLQNVITIDQAILEQTELLYGPGSLMYGSDALGGVIHFRTKAPQLMLDERSNKRSSSESNFYARYASAGNHKMIHYDFNLGFRKWAFLTSVSHANYGHLRAGGNRPDDFPEFGKRSFYVNTEKAEDSIFPNSDPNVQVGTAYRQFDFVQKVRFQPSHTAIYDLNLQLSNTSDIPRYDRLTELENGPSDPKFAEWYYGPQFRGLASFSAKLLRSVPFYDKATIIGAFQRIGEDRHDRRFGRRWRESTLVDLNVYTLTADFDKYLDRDKLKLLAYGFELAHNDVFSKAFGTNIATGEVRNNVNPRYPGAGSHLSSLGTYMKYQWQSQDSSMLFNIGLRYNRTSLSAKFDENGTIQWPNTYLEGIAARNSALVWATGFNLQTPDGWYFKLSTGTAYRAPNIDDFAKFREKNNFVSIPNPRLKPERAFTTELNVARPVEDLTVANVNIKKLNLSATGFYTRLADAIVREDFFLPNGSPFFISNADTLFVQANVNSEFAQIYGMSASATIDFDDHWRLHSNINFTRGRRSLRLTDDNGHVRLDTLVPQDHIPPLYGQTTLSYRDRGFSLDAVIRYNGRKRAEDYAVSSIVFNPDSKCSAPAINREGTADNIEQGLVKKTAGSCRSIYEGVYGWTTVNLYANYALNKHFSVNVGLENIADIHYRHFSSGVSAPGRNLIVALRGKF